MEIDNTEIAAGDVIEGFRDGGVIHAVRPQLTVTSVTITTGMGVCIDTEEYGIIFNIQPRILVRRRDDVPVLATAVTSSWNGKCRICGKGTYTGFFSVEHEGVCK